MSTYAQTSSIRESLERLQPDAHSCLMIYEAPEDQVADVTSAPGEVVNRKQIKENDRQVEKYVDVALYNRKQVPPQVLLSLIRSHPVVIWDGMVCENYGGQPEERPATDPTEEEVERVLASLRDRQRIKDGRSEMEALGRKAAALEHELEHMIATILLSTEPLIDGLSPNDSRLNLAKQILTAARNTTSLTNQLLAFGRPSRINTELLELNSAVADMENVLRGSLEEQSELNFVPDPGACPVNVDRGQLEQVLLGLVLNARDAMPQGGTIMIRTALTFKDLNGNVEPDSRAEPVVTISVTDTGHGMDANTQKRVFDPFFTTKDPGQGAGLGLSIVHGIVQKQFKGSISIESRLGIGTTVTIYLPLAEMRVAAKVQV